MPRHQIGYWRWVGSRDRYDPHDAELPDPRELTDLSWNPDAKQLVIDFLKHGKVVAAFGGCSTCRFNCGIADSLMGSHELADNLWVWPEGLAHYVEVHSVRLPPKFVEHVVKRNFLSRTHLVEAPQTDFDLSLWITWAREQRQTARHCGEIPDT